MRQIVNFFDRVEKFTLVWTIIGLALIGFIQVISRYVFNYSFTWFEELGRYLGVFIAFLGASAGVKSGSHFSMDLLVSKMSLAWQGRVKAGTNTICALFFLRWPIIRGKLWPGCTGMKPPPRPWDCPCISSICPYRSFPFPWVSDFSSGHGNV